MCQATCNANCIGLVRAPDELAGDAVTLTLHMLGGEAPWLGKRLPGHERNHGSSKCRLVPASKFTRGLMLCVRRRRGIPTPGRRDLGLLPEMEIDLEKAHVHSDHTDHVIVAAGCAAFLPPFVVQVLAHCESVMATKGYAVIVVVP